MNDPWVSCVHEGSLKGLRWREGDKACNTHFEFLVPLQNLRAQCDVVHRPLVIVVNDIAAFPPILALVSRLGPRLALALVHGLQAWRLCQLYALQAIIQSQRINTRIRSEETAVGEKELGGQNVCFQSNSLCGSKSRAPERP